MIKSKFFIQLGTTLSLLLSLNACQTSGSGATLKAKGGGCAIEDFEGIGQVSGGDECIATRILAPEGGFNNDTILIATLHGDDEAYGWDRISNELHKKYKNQNVAFLNAARIGFEYHGSKTTGYKPQYGSNSYTSDRIKPMLRMIKKVSDKFNVKDIQIWGYSGGAAVIASGAGKYAELLPVQTSQINLFSCPCNLTDWRLHNGWNTSRPGISPESVLENFPKQIKLKAFTPLGDTNTPIEIADAYIEEAENLGINAQSIPFSGVHNSVGRGSYSATYVASLEIDEAILERNSN